jgi:hypothetical protein
MSEKAPESFTILKTPAFNSAQAVKEFKKNLQNLYPFLSPEDKLVIDELKKELKIDTAEEFTPDQKNTIEAIIEVVAPDAEVVNYDDLEQHKTEYNGTKAVEEEKNKMIDSIIGGLVQDGYSKKIAESDLKPVLQELLDNNPLNTQEDENRLRQDLTRATNEFKEKQDYLNKHNQKETVEVAESAIKLTLPEDVLQLLGYGDEPLSEKQRQALQAVPRMKSRQTILKQQIDRLSTVEDKTEQQLKIKKSVEAIQKMYTQIQEELKYRSQTEAEEVQPADSRPIEQKDTPEELVTESHLKRPGSPESRITRRNRKVDRGEPADEGGLVYGEDDQRVDDVKKEENPVTQSELPRDIRHSLARPGHLRSRARGADGTSVNLESEHHSSDKQESLSEKLQDEVGAIAKDPVTDTFEFGNSNALQDEINAMAEEAGADEFIFRNNTPTGAVNKELAGDDAEGLFAWGERRHKLLGMDIPEEGPGGVFSARSFREGLLILEKRVPTLQKDAEQREKYTELMAILANIPDTGLTHVQAQRVHELAYSINIPESPLKLDVGRTIDEMYQGVEEKITQKLPTMQTLEKKRGFFGALARATVLSLPFVIAGSNLDKGGVYDVDAKEPTASTVEFDTQESVDTQQEVVTEVVPPPSQKTSGTFKEGIQKQGEKPDGIEYIDVPFSESSDAEQGYPYTYSDPNEYENITDPKTPTETPDWVAETMSSNVLEYTFEKGSSINTLSEAVFEKWKQQWTILDKPLSTNEFNALLYRTLADLEKDTNTEKALAEKMGIDSLDLDVVHSGKTINLQPFIDVLNQKLQ